MNRMLQESLNSPSTHNSMSNGLATSSHSQQHSALPYNDPPPKSSTAATTGGNSSSSCDRIEPVATSTIWTMPSSPSGLHKANKIVPSQSETKELDSKSDSSLSGTKRSVIPTSNNNSGDDQDAAPLSPSPPASKKAKTEAPGPVAAASAKSKSTAEASSCCSPQKPSEESNKLPELPYSFCISDKVTHTAQSKLLFQIRGRPHHKDSVMDRSILRHITKNCLAFHLGSIPLFRKETGGLLLKLTFTFPNQTLADNADADMLIQFVVDTYNGFLFEKTSQIVALQVRKRVQLDVTGNGLTKVSLETFQDDDDE